MKLDPSAQCVLLLIKTINKNKTHVLIKKGYCFFPHLCIDGFVNIFSGALENSVKFFGKITLRTLLSDCPIFMLSVELYGILERTEIRIILNS